MNTRKFALILILCLNLLFVGGRLLVRTAPGHSYASAQSGQSERVIMICVDGMVPDYYTAPEKLGLQVPNLTMMKNGGAYADGVESVYPTVTFPAHTTLVTGVRPAVHGIVQNRIFEAPTELQTRAWYWNARDLKTETLWTVAKKAGLVTAAAHWPVTIGADITYNVAEIYDYKESPATWKEMEKNATPGLLESALGSDKGAGLPTDEKLTRISEYVIRSYKPNLMLIHLIELDGVHHRNGPRTKEAIDQAQREDAYIGRIVEATKKAGTFDGTTFFIVSDHGFASISKGFAANVVLAKEGLITVDPSGKAVAWKAAAWPAGGSAAIMVKDPNDKETEKKVTEIFSKIAKEAGSPIKQVLRRSDLKKLGAIPQATLMLEAAPGFTFNEFHTGEVVRPSGETYKGTHGYLPTNNEMRASLIIYGLRAKKGGHASLTRMIDTAPTIAELLKLKLPQAEGKPLKELVTLP